MGLAGEIMEPFGKLEGNATYRNRIIDAVCQMDGDTLEKGHAMKLDKKACCYMQQTGAGLGRDSVQPGGAGAEGGATMIQLREKEMTEEAFIAEAQSIKELCGRYGVPFIINDSERSRWPDADGVHVGQRTWKQVMSAGGLEKQDYRRICADGGAGASGGKAGSRLSGSRSRVSHGNEKGCQRCERPDTEGHLWAVQIPVVVPEELQQII